MKSLKSENAKKRRHIKGTLMMKKTGVLLVMWKYTDLRDG